MKYTKESRQRTYGIWKTMSSRGKRKLVKKQGKSEGFESCDRPSNLTQIGFNRRFVNLCDLEIWWMTLKKL